MQAPTWASVETWDRQPGRQDRAADCAEAHGAAHVCAAPGLSRRRVTEDAPRPSAQVIRLPVRPFSGKTPWVQKPVATFDLLQWMQPPLREAFLRALKPKIYRAGQLIYSQGDAGAEMYRVSSGRVRLSVADQDGREVVFLLFEPGDCFGDASLVDGEPRPQTAEALTDLELDVLDKTAYGNLRAIEGFDDALLRLLARQMRFVSRRYTDLSLGDLRARVASRILEAAQMSDRKAGLGGGLSLRLPQSEIASLVGASRQTVNRVLRVMSAEGLIATEYNQVLVRDVDGLRRAARR
jgi:CRP/FNR family transcriptional regulator, cyclic AMP receptor protein